MATPLNLRAVNAMIARLQLIAVANGYNTDAGATVLHGRRVLEPDQLPAIVVFEGDETATATPAGAPANGNTESMRIALELNVEGYTRALPTVEGPGLSLLKADIKRAALKYSESSLADVGGVIGPVTYLGAAPLIRADGTAVEGVAVRFSVALIEGYGNPDAAR